MKKTFITYFENCARDNCSLSWPGYDLDSINRVVTSGKKTNINNNSLREFNVNNDVSSNEVGINKSFFEDLSRTDFSFGLPDVLFILTFYNTPGNEKKKNFIIKMFIPRELQSVNLIQLSKVLGIMKINELSIISINKFMEGDNSISFCDEVSIIRYIEVGYDFFIEDTQNDSKFMEYNLNTLYILRNGDFSEIKNIFEKVGGVNVNLGKGGAQNSHMLSPLDLRLSCYLMALFNFDYKYLNYLNTFNDIPKDRYLSFTDKSTRSDTGNRSIKMDPFNRKSRENSNRNVMNKKSFHTSCSVRTNRSKFKDEKKKDISTVFTYLDQIQDIIKNSESLFHAQK